MKKILSASVVTLLFAGLIGLTSCKKDVVVTVNIADQTACYPASPFISSQTIKTFDVTLAEIQSAFAQAGVTFSTDKIKTAKFKKFKAKIEANTTVTDFSHLSGMQLYVKETGVAGLGDQVAYADFSGTEVTLNLNGFDIKPLLSKNSMTLSLVATNKNNNTPEVCFKLTSGVIEFEAQK